MSIKSVYAALEVWFIGKMILLVTFCCVVIVYCLLETTGISINLVILLFFHRDGTSEANSYTGDNGWS